MANEQEVTTSSAIRAAKKLPACITKIGLICQLLFMLSQVVDLRVLSEDDNCGCDPSPMLGCRYSASTYYCAQKNLMSFPSPYEGHVYDRETPKWCGKPRSEKVKKLVTALATELQIEYKEASNDADSLVKSQEKIRRRRSLTCTPKNYADGSGALRICAECSVKTDLGVDYEPRYIYENICDSTDDTCFGEEGVCHESLVNILVNNTLTNELESKTMRTGCCCKLLPLSALIPLNV